MFAIHFCATCSRGGGISSKVVWLLLWRPDSGCLFRVQRGKFFNWNVRKQLSAWRCAVNTLFFAHVNDAWVRFWYWLLDCQKWSGQNKTSQTGSATPVYLHSKVATIESDQRVSTCTLLLFCPSSFPEPFTFPTNYWVILHVLFLQYVVFTSCIVMLVDALKMVQCTTVISSGL